MHSWTDEDLRIAPIAAARPSASQEAEAKVEGHVPVPQEIPSAAFLTSVFDNSDESDGVPQQKP